jgi:hypothetical protein
MAQRPDFDRSGERPEFGKNVGERIPSAALAGRWQTDTVKRSSGTHSRPLYFRPNDVQRDYTTGTLLFVFNDIAMDIPTLRWALHEAAIIKFMDQMKKFDSDNTQEAAENRLENSLGKRGPAGATAPLDKGMFLELREFVHKIKFAGALLDRPAPYLHTGRTREEYHGQYSGKMMAAPLAIWGACVIPNMFDNTEPIMPGQPLYILIKKIPRKWAGVHKTPDGMTCPGAGALATLPDEELTLDIVFYTSQNYSPPPRCTDPAELFGKNMKKQLPITCRQYKEFVEMARATAAPVVTSPSSPSSSSSSSTVTPPPPMPEKTPLIQDGHVIFIGVATQRYEPIEKVSADRNRQLPFYTNLDMNARPKMQIRTNPKALYF